MEKHLFKKTYYISMRTVRVLCHLSHDLPWSPQQSLTEPLFQACAAKKSDYLSQLLIQGCGFSLGGVSHHHSTFYSPTLHPARCYRSSIPDKSSRDVQGSLLLPIPPLKDESSTLEAVGQELWSLITLTPCSFVGRRLHSGTGTGATFPSQLKKKSD